MNVNVPKRARSQMAALEASAGSEPELLSHFANEVELFDDGTAMLTFGLFHTPEHNLLGIAIVVGKEGIILVDTSDMSLYAEFQWANLCRFDVKNDHDYQVVGIAWYEGERPISERLKEGTELPLSDMRFAYLYTHFDKEALSAIQRAFDSSAIPPEVHQRTPLL
jgi:hypothetical protein